MQPFHYGQGAGELVPRGIVISERYSAVFAVLPFGDGCGAGLSAAQ